MGETFCGGFDFKTLQPTGDAYAFRKFKPGERVVIADTLIGPKLRGVLYEQGGNCFQVHSLSWLPEKYRDVADDVVTECHLRDGHGYEFIRFKIVTMP
jgi:hypothetical protein